ncbi:hypothetical protein SBRY_10154 [Actinacidiphila bryophytorum]|uniref:Uncharacterized protein n=1 Tax=Actinacidiphila bryophytorum TaxID=1436133 RepID=A0A9W4GYE6_9ACTN|nr:hypothetical protein SBRY_10154 [Actinacidiphila bryophytorum]
MRPAGRPPQRAGRRRRLCPRGGAVSPACRRPRASGGVLRVRCSWALLGLRCGVAFRRGRGAERFHRPRADTHSGDPPGVSRPARPWRRHCENQAGGLSRQRGTSAAWWEVCRGLQRLVADGAAGDRVPGEDGPADRHPDHDGCLRGSLRLAVAGLKLAHCVYEWAGRVKGLVPSGTPRGFRASLRRFPDTQCAPCQPECEARPCSKPRCGSPAPPPLPPPR